MTANTLRLPSDRFQKLANDNRQEALYESQRQAISRALEPLGYRLFKLQGRPIFKIDDHIKIHYGGGKWTSENQNIQWLINRAIAGVKQ